MSINNKHSTECDHHFDANKAACGLLEVLIAQFNWTKNVRILRICLEKLSIVHSQSAL